MRLTNGVLFNVSDAALASQNALIKGLLKALGPVRGHRSDIDPEIWRLTATLASAGRSVPSQPELDSFLSDLENNSNQQVKIIKPCNNVSLLSQVRQIVIGPDSVRRSSTYLSNLRKSCPRIQFSVGGALIQNPAPLAVSLPHMVWEVELTAAKANREEEAAWLIDVALSVLRLAVKDVDLGLMAPRVGKQEAHAIDSSSPDSNRLTVGPGSSYVIGGWSLPNSYELGAKARRSLQALRARARTSAIFSAAKGSLAERFGQGLGWMTRARQSADRPTRLLYFFTAVESLLSDSDKTAPVVQTVARHAAVILSEDNKARSAIAKDLRTLYGLRSSLVHTGKRGIYDQDSNTIQYIAELLFWHVWSRIELSMPHQDFVQTLSKASYGLRLRSLL